MRGLWGWDRVKCRAECRGTCPCPFNVRFKHLSDRVAEREVCVAGYGGVDVRMHIGARGGFFSDGRHELGLAEGFMCSGPSVRYMDEHSRKTVLDDVVPGSEVAQQVVKHVVVAGPLPEW